MLTAEVASAQEQEECSAAGSTFSEEFFLNFEYDEANAVVGAAFTDQSLFENMIISAYNGVAADGCRSITAASIIESDTLVIQSQMKIAVRVEGVCSDCPSSPSISLSFEEIISLPVTCSCPAPLETDFESAVESEFDQIKANGGFPSLGTFFTLGQVKETPGCTTKPLKTFETVVMVEVFGQPGLLTPQNLTKFGAVFQRTYNRANGPNFVSCDDLHRTISNVTKVEQVSYFEDPGDDVFTDDNVDFGGGYKIYGIRLEVLMECRDCDTNLTPMFDEVSEYELDAFNQTDDDGGSFEVLERRRSLAAGQQGVHECHCRIPTDLLVRALSDYEMIVDLQISLSFTENQVAGLADIDDLYQVRVLDDCNPLNGTAPDAVVNYPVEFKLEINIEDDILNDDPDTPGGRNDIAHKLGEIMVASYNELAVHNCDPLQRRLAPGSFEQELLPPVAQRHRSLSWGFYVYTGGARCWYCYSDDHDSAQLFSPSGSNETVKTAKHTERRARFLQSTNQQCQCAVNSIHRLPSIREFQDEINLHVTEAIAAGILDGVTSLGVRNLEENVNSGPSSRFSSQNEVAFVRPSDEQQCTTDLNCTLTAGSGDQCIAGRCIHFGNPSFTLIWSGNVDFDLSVTAPEGNTIDYKNPFDEDSNGVMDNRRYYSQAGDRQHVENIFFPESQTIKGVYFVNVTEAIASGRIASRRRIQTSCWELFVRDENGAVVQRYSGCGASTTISFDYQGSAQFPTQCQYAASSFNLTTGTCTNISPQPLCTPFRSPEHCPLDESFPTYIRTRKSEMKQVLQTGQDTIANNGFWFHILEGKSAAYEFINANGHPTPRSYCCHINDMNLATNMNGCLNALPPGTGFVIRANGAHSNQGIYVLANGLSSVDPISGDPAGVDLLSGSVRTISEIVAAIQSLMGITNVAVEEFISGSSTGGSLPTLPAEYKFHMFNGQVGSISTIQNRGSSCGCYAETDENWNRLDKFGCFYPQIPFGQRSDGSSQQCYDSPITASNPYPMKGYDLCGNLPPPEPCVLSQMKSIALDLSSKIGVYVRIDFFVTDDNRVYVQEFSFHHNGGLRHCTAMRTSTSSSEGCRDTCFMGRHWKSMGGNAVYGGPGVLPKPLELVPFVYGGSTCQNTAIVSTSNCALQALCLHLHGLWKCLFYYKIEGTGILARVVPFNDLSL